MTATALKTTLIYAGKQGEKSRAIKELFGFLNQHVDLTTEKQVEDIVQQFWGIYSGYSEPTGERIYGLDIRGLFKALNMEEHAPIASMHLIRSYHVTEYTTGIVEVCINLSTSYVQHKLSTLGVTFTPTQGTGVDCEFEYFRTLGYAIDRDTHFRYIREFPKQLVLIHIPHAMIDEKDNSIVANHKTITV